VSVLAVAFDINAVPAGLWGLLSAVAVGLFGFLGLLIKLIQQVEVDKKELHNKVLDQVMPALQANARATESMVDATQQAITALAVARALKDEAAHSQTRRR
jgi:hypothetical protein